MTDTRVALGPDRLPWLTDTEEPRAPRPARKPREQRNAPDSRPWVLAAVAIVLAAAGYDWIATRTRTSEQQPTAVQTAQPVTPTVTVPLPDATMQPAPQRQVEIAPQPEVRPAPAPEIRYIPVPVFRSAPEPQAQPTQSEQTTGEQPATEQAEKPEPATAAPATGSANPSPSAAAPAQTVTPAPLASASSLKYWPSRVTDGAYGRLVQIGAFGSVLQAKRGWVHMARAYPGVKKLPAVVVETTNSKGRPFYRFQIGTTSQAHSEVLCQRMEKIQFSCAVVGLPWKPKGVER